MKIITGGQSGADISGNIFADIHGIPNEVNIFKEFRPIKGEKYPESTKINYVCDKHHYIGNLLCRTEYNVLHSDITFILIQKDIFTTKGSYFTYKTCFKMKKKVAYFDIYTMIGCCNISPCIGNINRTISPDDIKSILVHLKPTVINIAGQRELNINDTVSFLGRLLL